MLTVTAHQFPHMRHDCLQASASDRSTMDLKKQSDGFQEACHQPLKIVNNGNSSDDKRVPREQDDGAQPGLVPVSDSSQSTTDDSVIDASKKSSSTMIVPIPSSVQRPVDFMDSSSRMSPVLTHGTPASHLARKVTFGTVETKEYAMILGDHPDSEDGPALTIEWIPQFSKIDTVDHYEKTRSPRRGIESLKVAPFHREMYLKRVVGVSRDDLEISMRTAKDVRKQREDTLRQMKNEKFHVVVQSLQRKCAKVWGKRRQPFREATTGLSLRRSDNVKDVDVGESFGSSKSRRDCILSCHRGSCPDLSASRHPLPSDGTREGRSGSLDSYIPVSKAYY